MDINRKTRYFNLQHFMEYILKLCMFYLLSFLIIEMMFLAIKLYTYEIIPCFMNGIHNETLLQNQRFIDSVRHYCWAFGFFKDIFHSATSNDGPTLHKKVYLVPPLQTHVIMERNETVSTQQIVILTYCLFVVQILLYIAQKKINFYRPVINKLKDRSMLNYCDFDRELLASLVMISVKRSWFYFYCEFSVKLAYHLMLIGLTFSTKLLLFGQYPISQLDWTSLLYFPNEISLEPQDSHMFKDVKLDDQLMTRQLNMIFRLLWIVYLGMLAIYGLMMLVKVAQFSIAALRTKAIQSFAPNADKEVLEALNSRMSNYYFLLKVARNIDPFYFVVMIDEVFFIKNGKIEDGKSDGGSEHNGSMNQPTENTMNPMRSLGGDKPTPKYLTGLVDKLKERIDPESNGLQPADPESNDLQPTDLQSDAKCEMNGIVNKLYIGQQSN